MRNILTLFLLLVAFITSSSAEPIKAVLVVQNHASSDFQKPLSNITTKLSSKLSGEKFCIIDPNDRLGVNQNRRPYGEEMIDASTTALAQHLGAPVVITASITAADTESNEGRFFSTYTVGMGITLQAKKAVYGDAICGVEVFEEEVSSAKDFESNPDRIYNKLVTKVVNSVSKDFLDKCEPQKWNLEEIKIVEVAFGCNLPGANVSIDGISYGTAGTINQPPLRIKISDGVHNLKISYPYTTPYEVRAKLQEGTTFMVVLRENEEGRKIRKEDKHFDLLMDRIEKSGGTDDVVRKLKAQGYGNYLSSSYTRIEGMPEVLTMRDCELPNFGVNLDEKTDGLESTTSDLLNQAGSVLGLPVPEQKRIETEGTMNQIIPLDDMSQTDFSINNNVVSEETSPTPSVESSSINAPIVNQGQEEQEKTFLDEVGDAVNKAGGIATGIKNIIDLF